MTTISRTVEAAECPFKDFGVRAETVFHRYICQRGFERYDVSTVAYDTRAGDKRISSASHPACLWPDVTRYLSSLGRYYGGANYQPAA